MKTILPANVVSYIKDLERRIRLLETRLQLAGGKAVDIKQTITDVNDVTRIVIGLQDDQTYGIKIYDGIGNIIFNQGAS